MKLETIFSYVTMLWEVILLILSITLLCFYSLGVDLYKRWRDRKRAIAVGLELSTLPGKMAWEAEQRFGPPTEIVSGSSGRQLYVWKALSLPGIPDGGGLLVVTLTIEPDGTVAETHWQQRGKD